MAGKAKEHAARDTRAAISTVSSTREQRSVPLILAIAVVFIAVATSLWTNSRPEDVAAKDQPPTVEEEEEEKLVERPAIRAISPNHQTEYVDVLCGQANWRRHDAHTGRLLSQDQWSTRWLTHLQLRSHDDTWAAVDSTGQFELVHAGHPVWKSRLPDQQPEDPLRSCVLCAEQNLAAVISRNGTLWLLRFDRKSATLHARYQFNEPMASTSLSPAGDRLLLMTGRQELWIWNVAEARREHRIDVAPAGHRFTTWSGDGRRFALFGSNHLLEVRAADGELIRQIELSSAAVVAAALSSNGDWLAVGDGAMLRLIEVDSPAEASLLDGHDSLITALAFDEETRALFSGDLQGMLRRWALLDHREVWAAP